MRLLRASIVGALLCLCISAQADAADRVSYTTTLPSGGTLSIAVTAAGQRVNVDAMSLTCNGTSAYWQGSGADVSGGVFTVAIRNVVGAATGTVSGTVSAEQIAGTITVSVAGCDGTGAFVARNLSASPVSLPAPSTAATVPDATSQPMAAATVGSAAAKGRPQQRNYNQMDGGRVITLLNDSAFANVDALSMPCSDGRPLGQLANVVNAQFTVSLKDATSHAVIGTVTGRFTDAAADGIVKIAGCPAWKFHALYTHSPKAPDRAWTPPTYRCSLTRACTDAYWTARACKTIDDCSAPVCSSASNNGVMWHHVLVDTAKSLSLPPDPYSTAIDHALLAVAARGKLQETFNVDMYCGRNSREDYFKRLAYPGSYTISLDIPTAKMLSRMDSALSHAEKVDEVTGLLSDLTDAAATATGKDPGSDGWQIGPAVRGWVPRIKVSGNSASITFTRAS